MSLRDIKTFATSPSVDMVVPVPGKLPGTVCVWVVIRHGRLTDTE